MIYVGIDLSDKHHDLCLVDEKGKKLNELSVEHSSSGFLEILEKVRRLECDKSKVAFCLETSQGLLVEFILDNGYVIYPVNPKAAERVRERYKVSGAKDDSLDAWTLANFLRTDKENLRPLLPSSELARKLKIFTSDRKSLVEAKTCAVNQLIACLKRYYPRPLEIFEDIQSQIALSFLKHYSTPQKAKRLTRVKFEKFLKDYGYSCPRKIDEMWEKLHKPMIPVEEWVQESKSVLALALVDQLTILIQQIKSYDKEIKNLMSSHPDSKIFKSLPGAGEVLQSQMLANFGDNREVYSTFQSIQRQAGTCPITKQSGEHKFVYFRRACNHYFRATMQNYAFTSLKCSLWARRYYDKKRKKGATHEHALRCLANIWVKVIHTLWKKETLYIENIRLAGIARYALQQPIFTTA